ncbi:hypothetical protein [Methyloferula stellata]|uniref:hypothetical protein n=1 Tax=Methyloferula stellata TaxID=876270 RepID=UPI0012686A09|nr:hypothetical protein [Methyloferula stellata]
MKEVMTEDEWKAHARQAVAQMKNFTAPFVSPISYEKPNDVPRLSGTGSFIEIFSRRFLLTNEHVLIDDKTGDPFPDLAYGLRGTDNVFRMLNGQVSAGYPIDCAIAPITAQVWEASHQAATIPEALITWAHVPVPREILFFRGYAQENSSFHFENLLSGSTSYGTQEMAELPDGLNSRFFFTLHHSPEKAEMIDGDRSLPLPPGFSGSTVWNTRYVECLSADQAWTPAEARVSGIVCRWRTGDTGIVVLRIEYMRSWLLNALNEMSLNNHF